MREILIEMFLRLTEEQQEILLALFENPDEEPKNPD
jgi:hypothetical protein